MREPAAVFDVLDEVVIERPPGEVWRPRTLAGRRPVVRLVGWTVAPRLSVRLTYLVGSEPAVGGSRAPPSVHRPALARLVA